MIPFFRVTQPVELEILKLFLLRNMDYEFGLITHTSTSKNFRMLFKDFPSSIQTDYDIGILPVKVKIPKIVYFKGFNKPPYSQVFDLYVDFNADFGLIETYGDFLNDAERALKDYKKGNHTFKPIAVIPESNTIKSYTQTYRKLKRMGYEYIAVDSLSGKLERITDLYEALCIKDGMSMIETTPLYQNT